MTTSEPTTECSAKKCGDCCQKRDGDCKGFVADQPTTGEIVRALRCIADNAECKDCRYKYPVGNVILCDHEQMNGNAADRLESQEREIERLKSENEAMFRLQMGNQGVYVPDGSEYQPITFFGYPVTDALRKIEEHAALTDRAEQAEKERDAANERVTDYELSSRGF